MLQNRPKDFGDSQVPPPLYPGADASGFRGVMRDEPAAGRRRGLLPQWITSSLPLVIVLGVAGVGLERFAPEDYKPSTILGGFYGHAEAVKLRTQLEAAQAMLAAQNAENVRMQNQIEYFKAKTDRVTEAYKIAYQRVQQASDMMVEIQKQYATARQKMIEQSEGGNIMAAQLMPFVQLYGLATKDPSLVQGAGQIGSTLRSQALADVDSGSNTGLANVMAHMNELKQGLVDINQLDQIVADDSGVAKPVPASPAPLPPTTYQAVAQLPAPAVPAAQRPTSTPTGAQQPGPASAAPLRLLSIKLPNVYVRSDPTVANNQVCVLTQGQVVALLHDDKGEIPRVLDAGGKITFVPVVFNWQGKGVTRGWVSERVLSEIAGAAPDVNAPQPCIVPPPGKA